MDRTKTAQALYALRSLFAHARCLVCLEEDTWLCDSCGQLGLPRPTLSCLGCGEENQRGLTCQNCRENCVLVGSIHAGPYTSKALQRGIRWLKFKGVQDVAHTLALMLIPHLAIIAPIPDLATKAAIIPIPLHKRRQRQRGFNQSSLIADEISRLTNIPVCSLLQRSRATRTQSHLPHNLRTKNTRDAFTPTSEELPLQIQLIILIDDVTTTGATLEAAASALQPTLPQQTKIWAATIARG